MLCQQTRGALFSFPHTEDGGAGRCLGIGTSLGEGKGVRGLEPTAG